MAGKIKKERSAASRLTMILVMRIDIVLMTASPAVVHFSVKSIFTRAILHRSDIAIRLLHGIFPEQLRACKTPTYELFVLRCPTQSWHIWDTRYRSFLWRRIEIYTGAPEYEVFSLLSEIHNHLSHQFFMYNKIKKQLMSKENEEPVNVLNILIYVLLRKVQLLLERSFTKLF